jgi:hypothetical protein
MEPDWQKLYLSLYAFADQILKSQYWFRGKGTDSFFKGKQPHDYTQDAIEKYWLEPEKFDPTQMSLLGYLKKHILRRAVGNDSKRLENRFSSDIFKKQYRNNNDDNEYLDDILPFQQAIFDQQMDLDLIMDFIADQIKHDTILVKVFHGHCRDRLERREVIQEYKLSDTEYDNGFRRLKTILKDCAIKFYLEPPKQVKTGRKK